MNFSCKYQNYSNNIRTLCLGISLFLNSLTFGNAVFTITGNIIDAQTQEPLIGATIIAQNTLVGVVSDIEGKFSLRLLHPDTMIISYVGYQPVKYYVENTTFLAIQMKSELLEEVIITATSGNKPQVSGLGTISISKAMLQNSPQIMGEYEVLRTIQTLPGVISSNDGDRGIFIRGGSTDQTLMMLDNMPIYNASHLYGFLSVFNGDAIDETQVYKSYLPPRYGGRLAAAVNVSTAAEDRAGWHGSFRVGTFTSAGYLSGKIKNKTTIYSSIRGSYAGTYLRPLSRSQFSNADGTNGGEIGYYFFDANIGADIKINDKNTIKIRTFFAQDRFQYIEYYSDYDETHTLRSYNNNNKNVLWRNQMGSITIESSLPKKWHLTSVLGNSYYALNSTKYYDEKRINSSGKYSETYLHDSERSYIMDFIVQFNISKQLNDKTIARIGIWNSCKPIQIMDKETYKSSGKQTDYSFPKYIMYENLHYAEIDKLFKHDIRLNLGFRNTLAHSNHTYYYNIEPRIYVNFPITKGNTYLSTQYTTQNIHMLTSSSADILNDLWLPITKTYRPQSAYIVETGLRQKFKSFSYEFSAYFRKLWHLVEFTGSQSHLDPKSTLAEQIATDVKGTAYGCEAAIQYSFKILEVRARYNFTQSKRLSPNINQGFRYPFKYERPNDFNINMNIKLGKKWTFNTAWTYTNGSNVSLPNSQYASMYTSYNIDMYNNETPLQNVNQASVLQYSGKNNYRLPSNHHWDISFLCKKIRKRVQQEFNISIYNLYNRKNIFTIYQEYPSGKTKDTQYKKITLMPLMPFFSYAFKF